MKAQKIKQFILDFNEIKEEAIGLWGKDEHTGEYNEYLICKNCDNTHHGIGSAEEWEETKDYHKFCTKCGNKFEVETEEVIYDNYWENQLQRLFCDDGFRKETLNKLK